MGRVIPKRRRPYEQRYRQAGHCHIQSPGLPHKSLAQTAEEQRAVWTLPHRLTRFSNAVIYIIACSCWSQSVPAASSRGRHHACRLPNRIKLSPLLILANETISLFHLQCPTGIKSWQLGCTVSLQFLPSGPHHPSWSPVHFHSLQGHFPDPTPLASKCIPATTVRQVAGKHQCLITTSIVLSEAHVSVYGLAPPCLFCSCPSSKSPMTSILLDPK